MHTPTPEEATSLNYPDNAIPFQIEEIKKADELFDMTIEGSPYDFEQMLPIEKRGQRSLAKKKLKQLKVLDPVIRGMLHEGEEVIYLTDGVKVHSAEQLFIGWLMYYYNHNAFIFTNERILLIHVIKKTKLGKFVGAIRYEDLLKVKTSFTGSLRIKFRNKKQVLFTRVAGQDRKFIKEFLVPLVENSAATVDKQAPMIQDLCPACYQKVDDKNASECPSCQCGFRTPRQAAIRSLILPGLGDIYLGSALGYLEAAFMLFLWTGNIFGSIELIREGEEPAAVWISTLIFLGIIHLLDAAKSHYVARKGIFPKEAIQGIRNRQQAKVGEGYCIPTASGPDTTTNEAV
ncbi:hypothetical protein DDZ13_02785 [Coraliomargarita sinensis]|uniref:YokE-like PH domain-containing protein n=1 Tax=Coraliomargarita sinensis TaxID=2174842 RepID=A0A317ZL53_9BACT|nr:hypothetical protein [Coraliomargarita sinensis]PXA04907.1 hypothetical protein DDZ13_02785 [Coraliomargarita sinensis]